MPNRRPNRRPLRRSSRLPLFVGGILLIAAGGVVAWKLGWVPPGFEERLAVLREWTERLRANHPTATEDLALVQEAAGDTQAPPFQFDPEIATAAQPVNAEPMFSQQSEPPVESQSEPVPVDAFASQQEPSQIVQTAATQTPTAFDPAPTQAAPTLAAPAVNAPNPFPTPEPTAAPLNPAPATAATIDLTEIDKLIQAGDFLAAHREISKLYWDQPDWREMLRERIESTARSIFFSPQPHYMQPYVVQTGDQLRNIAQKYNVPWEYLSRLNSVDPRRIQVGQKLKVVKGPFSAFVDLSDFELTIHAQGYYVRRYQVGIGRDGTTPLGTFTVHNKLENPTYYGPQGNVVDADDPTNPLGERWIDIGDGYGIHGTIEPNSIGRAESRGCIRLIESDVAEVFDFLSPGSPVVIQR